MPSPADLGQGYSSEGVTEQEAMYLIMFHTSAVLKRERKGHHGENALKAAVLKW